MKSKRLRGRRGDDGGKHSRERYTVLWGAVQSANQSLEIVWAKVRE